VAHSIYEVLSSIKLIRPASTGSEAHLAVVKQLSKGVAPFDKQPYTDKTDIPLALGHWVQSLSNVMKNTCHIGPSKSRAHSKLYPQGMRISSLLTHGICG
jgi:hypothetical protein